jgi:hypothetical protein
VGRVGRYQEPLASKWISTPLAPRRLVSRTDANPPSNSDRSASAWGRQAVRWIDAKVHGQASACWTLYWQGKTRTYLLRRSSAAPLRRLQNPERPARGALLSSHPQTDETEAAHNACGRATAGGQ